MKDNMIRLLVNPILPALFVSGTLATSFAQAATVDSSERAATYEIALARAKATGKDIVVFQRGSDWNRLGEELYNTIWLNEGFVRELGPGFILAAVDHQEEPGSMALTGLYRGTAAAVSASGVSSPQRLAQMTAEGCAIPPNSIVSVGSKDGTTFKSRPDGAWLAQGANPSHEVLTLKITTRGGGRVLRIDFPTDPALPGAGPGRGDNGNFAISEIVAEIGAKPVKFTGAWASAFEGGWGAWLVIDGISDQRDNLWNSMAHQHQRRTLLLSAEQSFPANSELSVQLICRSRWDRHVPGCLRAAVLSDATLDSDIQRVCKAQMENAQNSRFSWWDMTYCPRIALMDSQGRAVTCENKPRLGLTAKSLAQRIKEMRGVREKRDALWQDAEKAQGPQKAELLRQSLDLMKIANWAGNENCYQFVHDKIRQADPTDQSGAVYWLGFGGHDRDGAPGLDAVWKARDEKRYDEALALVDKLLAEPRTKVLNHGRIQRIMLAKFHVYRSWPGHEEQRFDVQREIAALDPTTYLGIGAVGYLGMHHRTPVPMLTYGWVAGQVKEGSNVWNMTDNVGYYMDHAGTYSVSLNHTGGPDTVRVKSIAVMDGKDIIAEANPGQDMGPGKNVSVMLDLKNWQHDHTYTLRVEIEAAEGKTNNQGNIAIEPVFVAPTATAASPAAPATNDELTNCLSKGDILAWQKRQADQIILQWSSGLDAPSTIISTPRLRLALAQVELIRAAGADRVTQIAKTDGGVVFLSAFLRDVEWLESFLASGQSEYGQSLENLRFLYRFAPVDFTTPIYKRMATAMALSVGESHNRYRLFDRFKRIQKTLHDGLLHVSFENLTVRQMRFATYMAGTERDYQYLLDDRQQTIGDYFGACWAVPYRGDNDYGYSVQGAGYTDPWLHHYGTGTGNRPFIAQKELGGVCGTLSSYGAAAAGAHGVMSTAVGQPGHCAYVIRKGDTWGIAYDISGPAATGFGAWGWDGTGFSVAASLWEKVEADRERFMNSQRLIWLARLQADRSKIAVRILPGLQYKLYRQGVGADLPDFSKLKPERSGTVERLDLPAIQPSPCENFGVVWEGQIEVTGQGLVRVSTSSDDSSRVLIDGQPVVSANCARQEKEINLTAGKHPLRVEFSQGGGPFSLKVGFDGVISAASGNWTGTYERAIAAQPLNYGTWIDYVKALEGVKNVSPTMWLNIGRRAAETFATWHQPAWALANRCLERAEPTLKPQERGAYFLELHRILKQEKATQLAAYDYSGNFEWQANRLGDAALQLQFFGALLSIHHSNDPLYNGFFGSVLNWGNNRFAGNPATSAAYAKTLANFFGSQSAALDKGMLTGIISGGIRKASEAGDFSSYKQWNEMAKRMLPPIRPEDVHLNSQQSGLYPKFAPFPGDLLSKDGMLRTSSACPSDRPLAYSQAISSGQFGGWFDTNSEDKPWAMVQLPGDCKISGIVLVNRYENSPDNAEFKWAAPLKVTVSTDAKTWSDVATVNTPEAVMRIDLQAKAPQARYVKIERIPSAQPAGRFHFRGFLIYGRRLY